MFTSTWLQPYATGSYPCGVTVGDLNNDNHLGIVVTNYNSDRGTISILLGYGNGSFREEMLYVTGLYPRSVAVGDLRV
jgi:hypothetical protein